MKKILTLLFVAFAAKAALAQDVDKSFRFGLRGSPSLNWYKPDDKKKFESDGVRMKFGYGLMTEIRLSKVASIATGIGFDYDGGKIDFLNDTATGYYVKNNEFVEIEEIEKSMNDTNFMKDVAVYYLKQRSYNANYITIPLTLKMKTKEIGMLTYYGQFGMNASFRTKSRVDDEYTSIGNTPANSSYNGKEMDNTDDMNLFRFALNVGGGAEYNLSGTTSLVFGLNFYNGFSNVLKKNSRYLQDISTLDNMLKFVPLEQKATANAFALTVGILF
jgi:hypothetical protein